MINKPKGCLKSTEKVWTPHYIKNGLRSQYYTSTTPLNTIHSFTLLAFEKGVKGDNINLFNINPFFVISLESSTYQKNNGN